MKPKKLFVLIPDGVGLRNFAYTQFPNFVKEAGWELVYWNATSFDLQKMGFQEIKLHSQARSWTDLLKRAKIISELNHFGQKSNNPVYEKYKFPAGSKGWKKKLKNSIVSGLVKKFQGEKGLGRLRQKMEESERKSGSYQHCKALLKKEQPDVVFCTSQRPVNAIAPVLAAKDLVIPTVCFIFSWDNLPKATKVIDTDYYFVWSEYMKAELLKYYPYIQSNQVRITGTPQFEMHYNKNVVLPKEVFFKKYQLNNEKKYLCFSGDDITTSPHDEYFLKDVAIAVKKLNEKGENIGIIFRRCPVDFSGRYDNVLKDFSEIIISIDPNWTGNGDSWNEAMPKKEDLILQTNIVEYSFMVINVASSMVFDFAARGKPCAYLNYLLPLKDLQKDIREIYHYVHFESMPTKDSVYWIDKKEDIETVILKSLKTSNKEILERTKEWFERINKNAGIAASQEIIQQIKSLG